MIELDRKVVHPPRRDGQPDRAPDVTLTRFVDTGSRSHGKVAAGDLDELEEMEPVPDGLERLHMVDAFANRASLERMA